MRGVLALALFPALALAGLGALRAKPPAPAAAAAPMAPQYTHSGWTSSQGVPGMVSALAQTPDGYLWLGTYEGLYRFDGVSFEQIPAAPGHPEGAVPVTGVYVTRKGELWVGYAGRGGVEIYRDGHLVRAAMPDAPGEITGFAEDSEGGIFMLGGRDPDTLARYWQGRWQRFDTRRGVPSEAVSGILAARDGTVWLATTHHLLFLRKGASAFEDSGEVLVDGNGLAQDAAGAVWISGPTGTRMLPDYPRGERRPRNPVVYPAQEPVRRVSLLFAHDGALWGSTYVGGLFRIDAPGRAPGRESSVAHLGAADGMTSNQAVAILQDREGSVWAATEIGLDQFRKADIVQARVPPRTSARGYRLARDHAGAIVVASGTTLFRAGTGEELQPVRALRDMAAMCTDRAGQLWVVDGDAALHLAGTRLLDRVALPPGGMVNGCGVDRLGRLWLANGGMARGKGVAFLKDGHWHPVDLPPGSSRPRDIIIDAAGNLIVLLSNRALAMMDDGGPPRVVSGETLDVAGITGVFPTDFGLLVAGGTGIALWDGHKVAARLTIRDHPWLRGLRGLVQTRKGEVWTLDNRGINHFPADALRRAFAHPHEPIPHVFLGEPDGFYSRSNGEPGMQGAEAADGRIWFLTRQGPVWIDPQRQSSNPLSPTVYIRGLVSGAHRYADPHDVMLPAGSRNLSIDYTALSLVVPSRVAFRYRLEGVDADWVDPGTRRQAFYTNLGPGSYRFTVIAANNKGVWNRRGAELRFTIPPTFVQSRLFAGLCLAALGLLLWFLYDMRIRTLSRRMKIGIAERANERERIARELHDTLLQGVQALMLRFHLAAMKVADSETREQLDAALDRAEAVLVEGRERLLDLRATTAGDDLEVAMLAVVGRHDFPRTIATAVVVKGKPRPVRAPVTAAIEPIVSEALFNVCRHAQATHASVDIEFGIIGLTVTVRDNGVGIPARVLDAGGEVGHFGLTGMMERAHQIAGRLTFRSGPGRGTQVVLKVPASVAYHDVRFSVWRRLSHGAKLLLPGARGIGDG